MTCAVRTCRKEIFRRPDLSFFPLPKHHDIKDEWLEILGIEPHNIIGNIKVCELHFKPKDFGVGKNNMKQLKSHAVPVLNLGRRKSEPIDSDEEFMEYNSDADIVELPSPTTNIKSEQKEKTPIVKEPEIEEVDEGRRPSRRAAREAAKKISNTVRNFMPKSDETVFSPLPSISASPGRPRRRYSAKMNPAIFVDLVMECHEEILSPSQAEALLKAQLEYNMVMKTLRSLKASNVKIICAKEPYPAISQPVATSSPKIENNSVSVNASQTTQKTSVVPIILSSNSPLVIQTTTVA